MKWGDKLGYKFPIGKAKQSKWTTCYSSHSIDFQENCLMFQVLIFLVKYIFSSTSSWESYAKTDMLKEYIYIFISYSHIHLLISASVNDHKNDHNLDFHYGNISSLY